MMLLSTPDVTKAQIVALIQAVVQIVVALGVNVPESTSVALIGSATVIAAALSFADAHIRHGRSVASAANAIPDPPDVPLVLKNAPPLLVPSVQVDPTLAPAPPPVDPSLAPGATGA